MRVAWTKKFEKQNTMDKGREKWGAAFHWLIFMSGNRLLKYNIFDNIFTAYVAA
jgi:hypothetical protein